MSGGGAKEEPRSSDWRDFFWNPRTHELLGRTATSWGLIFLFYLVFYLFLAGMFALTMHVMILTLDDYSPTWQDRLSTPGMMIRPKGDQLYISFSVSDFESYQGFINNLDSFLSPYNDSIQAQTNDNCPQNQFFIQEDSGEVRNNPKRSCQFNRTLLESCSGISDQFYGFNKGQPCVLIKLNRKEDRVKMGPLAYFPPNGTFNLMYYPYYGKKAQVNYTQPLVALKFLNASLNTDISVECRIHSNTLQTLDANDRDKFAGRVSFMLRINE